MSKFNKKHRDQHLIYLQIIFMASLLLILIVKKQIFLKILLVLLTFLFYFKEIEAYPYIKQKYNYVGIGFTAILGVFIFLEFFSSIHFLTIFMCLIVAYFYLYKVLFNTSYGVVLKSTQTTATIRLTDPFIRSKKEYVLKTKTKLAKDTLVIVELSSFFINKKPIKIKKIISE